MCIYIYICIHIWIRLISIVIIIAVVLAVQISGKINHSFDRRCKSTKLLIEGVKSTNIIYYNIWLYNIAYCLQLVLLILYYHYYYYYYHFLLSLVLVITHYIDASKVSNTTLDASEVINMSFLYSSFFSEIIGSLPSWAHPRQNDKLFRFLVYYNIMCFVLVTLLHYVCCHFCCYVLSFLHFPNTERRACKCTVDFHFSVEVTTRNIFAACAVLYFIGVLSKCWNKQAHYHCKLSWLYISRLN